MRGISQVLLTLAALTLFAAAADAAPLRATILIGGDPGTISLRVSHGRIVSLALTLPPATLPAPWEWQFPAETTYNGVLGRIYDQEISAKVVSNVSLNYTRIKPRSALEFQSEEKVYSHAGTQQVFYPSDDSASTVVSQNLTPLRELFSGARTAAASVYRTVRNGELRMMISNASSGAVSPLSVITISSTTLVLIPEGRNRWRARVLVERSVSHSDYTSLDAYSGEAVLQGRAEIDASQFDIPEAPNQPHF
jgi:hypothetical protein